MTSTPPTSFPTRQLVVLALCRICEPIAFMSIFPYVYYMVRAFDTTRDAQQLAFYVGMVTSAFAFAEFSSGVVWGRISDRVGRKPVLMCGLAGTAVSMLVFGFAPSLPIALLGRALGGLLNGNMGVLQTTVAEIVTVKEHQPRAFSIMPSVWCLGSVLGPALGGALAQPHEHYPWLVTRGSLFDRHPFLLPNLVCAIILACGVVVGVLFLEETHPRMKYRRDLGIEVGHWLLGGVKPQRALAVAEKGNLMNSSADPFLPEDDPPVYRSTESTPRNSLSHPAISAADHARNRGIDIGRPSKPPGIQKAFTKSVMLNIMGFGLLAYHSISFDQLMPVFLSEPDSYQAVSMPFSFTGGFGFSSKTIGFMLSVQGIYSMIAQLFFFPYAARTLGALKTFRVVVIMWPLLYFLVPYTVLLPHPFQKTAIYACLLLKITFHVCAFPAMNILLTNSAPSTLVLGAINGVAASTASLARAFGPSVTGLMHSWGLSLGCTGLAWWINGLICALGAFQSLYMYEVTNGRTDQHADNDDDEEAASTVEPLLNVQRVQSCDFKDLHHLPQSDQKS